MRSIAACVLAIFAAMSVTGVCAENRDALRQIVQDQCVVNWRKSHESAPCARIFLPDPDDLTNGFAVLPDRKGGAHFLLIPTRTVAGMESPEAWLPGAPNYFAAAWQARDLLAIRVGHEVPRDAVGLAINSQRARSQDQLHIHIECVNAQVHQVLKESAEAFNNVWSPINIAGWNYQGMRVMADELQQANPFELLADGIPDAKGAMSAYTLVVVGMEFERGPGFVLLAGRAVPTGELLLDSTCTVAR